MDLLFKHGYTIKLPEELDIENYTPDTNGVDPNTVWRKGVSTVGTVPQSRRYGNSTFETHRRYVLRVIVAVISQPLYFK